MEKEKNNKKIIVIIALISLLVIGISAYIAYRIIQTEEEIIENGNDQEEYVPHIPFSKVYEDREWIFDAEYERVLLAPSFTLDERTYYDTDILSIPFINIDSNDAAEVNKQIREIFDSTIEGFNGVIEQLRHEEETGEMGKLTWNTLSYKYTIIGNTLSVIIISEGTCVGSNYYSTFNLDIETGRLLTFNEIYRQVGFNSSDINEIIETVIEETMEERIDDLFIEGNPYTDYEIVEFIEESIDNFRRSISTDSIKYFIDEIGRLNVVVTLMIPVHEGAWATILTI